MDGCRVLALMGTPFGCYEQGILYGQDVNDANPGLQPTHEEGLFDVTDERHPLLRRWFDTEIIRGFEEGDGFEPTGLRREQEFGMLLAFAEAFDRARGHRFEGDQWLTVSGSEWR